MVASYCGALVSFVDLVVNWRGMPALVKVDSSRSCHRLSGFYGDSAFAGFEPANKALVGQSRFRPLDTFFDNVFANKLKGNQA